MVLYLFNTYRQNNLQYTISQFTLQQAVKFIGTLLYCTVSSPVTKGLYSLCGDLSGELTTYGWLKRGANLQTVRFAASHATDSATILENLNLYIKNTFLLLHLNTKILNTSSLRRRPKPSDILCL